MKKRMIKKTLLSCILLAGIVSLTACKNQTQTSESTENNESVHKFCSLEELFQREDTALYGLTEEHIEEYIADATVWAQSGEKESDLNDILYERDGDFIWAMHGEEAGMQRVYYTILRSLDGGNTWEIWNEQVPITNGITDIEVKDSYVIYTYGSGMWWSIIDISSDYGDSFSTIDTMDQLPEDLYNATDVASGRITSIDLENNLVTFSWYNSYSCVDEPDGLLAVSELFLDTEELIFSTETSSMTNAIEFLSNYAQTGYYFENTSSEYLDENDLKEIFSELYHLEYHSWNEVSEIIRKCINEIYARKGYDFTGTKYEDYFNSQSWYEPISGKVVEESELNSYEKANIDLLVKLEQEYLD